MIILFQVFFCFTFSVPLYLIPYRYHFLLKISVTFKIYGYTYTLEDGEVDTIALKRGVASSPARHPINVGANLYGVAACLAFLKVKESKTKVLKF